MKTRKWQLTLVVCLGSGLGIGVAYWRTCTWESAAFAGEPRSTGTQPAPGAKDDGSVLPFPPTPSASVPGTTIQESQMKWRVEPKRLKAGTLGADQARGDIPQEVEHLVHVLSFEQAIVGFQEEVRMLAGLRSRWRMPC